MTAIGWRAATAGVTGRPVSGPGTRSGVGSGVAVGTAVAVAVAVGLAVAVGPVVAVGVGVASPAWSGGRLGVGVPPSEVAATTTTSAAAPITPIAPTVVLRVTFGAPPGSVPCGVRRFATDGARAIAQDSRGSTGRRATSRWRSSAAIAPPLAFDAVAR